MDFLFLQIEHYQIHGHQMHLFVNDILQIFVLRSDIWRFIFAVGQKNAQNINSQSDHG